MQPSSGFFPLGHRRRLWKQAAPNNYVRKIEGPALVRAMIGAYVLRLSGLREIAGRMQTLLGTSNHSALSHALSRESTLTLVRSMVQALEAMFNPGRDDLVAIDSMAVTLPSTQRHNCKKYNKTTVGGGVLWAFMIDAPRGACPVKVIQTMAGSWGDSALMAGVKLIAKGPVYLMDRGFWSIDLIERWMSDEVRFIVRARYNTVYEVLRKKSLPRAYGKQGRIELDARVRLGWEKHKRHPEARMIRAKVGEEYIILVTSEMRWSAERILDAYRKRERIERFHRVLKDQLGLSHLYNFSQTGMTTLLYIALLTALLIFLGENESTEGKETIKVLREGIDRIKRSLGMGNIWRRNTNTIKRKPSARVYKWQLQNL